MNRLLLCALATVAMAALVAADLTKPYVHESSSLAMFQSGGTPALPGSDAFMTYLYKIMIPSIVIIVVGALAFFTFVWWSMCGCGCCPCCKKEGGEVDCFCLSEDKAKLVYLFMALALTAAVIGCGAQGLTVNTMQSDGFNALKPAGDALAGWTNNLTADISSEKTSMAAASAALSDPDGQFAAIKANDANDPRAVAVDAFVSATVAGTNALQQLEDAIKTLKLDQYGTEFDKLVKPVNDYREIALLAALGLLLGIVLLQLLVALLNIYAPESLKPNECCLGQILQGTFTAIFLIAFLLVWIAFAVFYAVTTVPADICGNQKEIIDLTGLGSEFGYFITCSALSEAEKEAQNPFKAEFDQVKSTEAQMQSAWETLQNNMQGNACPGGFSPPDKSCDAQLERADEQVKTTSVVPILSYGGCDKLNQLWNIVANTLCGTVGSSLAATTVLLGAIACLMLVTEPVRCKLNEIHKNDDGNKVA